MDYKHLTDELARLAVNIGRDDFYHIAARPMTLAEARRKGLTNIASNPGLAAKMASPKSRRIADRMADDPFTWGKDCHPGRYSKGFPALYASKDMPTCEAERAWHLARKNGVSGGKRPTFLILTGRVDGATKDLHAMPANLHVELVHETDYRPTQAIGDAARAEPLAYLSAPSARAPGVNFPIFQRAAISGTAAEREIVFFLDDAGKIATTTSWAPGRRRR